MSCPICQKHLGDQEKVVLREKGAAGINTWAEKKAHSLRVIAGLLVHTKCRRKYTKPEKRDNPPVNWGIRFQTSLLFMCSICY